MRRSTRHVLLTPCATDLLWRPLAQSAAKEQEDVVQEERRRKIERQISVQDPLRSQASGISEGGLGRPMSELDINMDDLLGLNDSPFEANKADPFRVGHSCLCPPLQS